MSGEEEEEKVEPTCLNIRGRGSLNFYPSRGRQELSRSQELSKCLVKGVRVGHAFELGDSLLLSSSILKNPSDFIDSLESVNSEVLTQRLDFQKSGSSVVIPFPDWF